MSLLGKHEQYEHTPAKTRLSSVRFYAKHVFQTINHFWKDLAVTRVNELVQYYKASDWYHLEKTVDAVEAEL